MNVEIGTVATQFLSGNCVSTSTVASKSAVSSPTVLLKVPKCEIFDNSGFDDFYTIKSLWGATFGLK